ncbi:MAG: alpha/beta hydrolase [Chloroflexota bacterium]
MPIAANVYYAHHPRERGDKPAVVLIHGAGGTHLYWPAEVRRLPGYDVFALDLPGHGKSEGVGQQSIEGYVEAVLNWMEAVGLHKAMFVGHSMGGAIALLLGLEHSERVLGLGLVSTGGRLKVAPIILESTASSVTFQSVLPAIAEWAFSEQADPQLLAQFGKDLAETRSSVLHGDFMACDAFDVLERLEAIQAPTLVLCGQNDRMTPVRHSEFLADHIPSSKLEIIPASGHMVMLEQPATVAEALLSFFNELAHSV